MYVMNFVPIMHLGKEHWLSHAVKCIFFRIMNGFLLLLPSSLSFSPFFPSSPPTSQTAVISMHLGTNTPSWAPLPLSTVPTLGPSQPGIETISQSQATSPALTSVLGVGTHVTFTYQLTKLAYRWPSFCMWLVSSLGVHETHMHVYSISVFTWN